MSSPNDFKAPDTSCSVHRLRDAIEGTLDSDSQSQLEQHLSSCSACRSQLEEIASDTHDWNVVRQSLNDISIQSANGPTSDVHFIVDPEKKRQTEFEPFLDQPAHPETLGAIDGFEVEQFIGRGGMGVVYRGFDRELNRPVAIKFLAPHLAANGVARKRFAREARAAAAVVHPNIVSIHSVSSSQERPYLVMSLVPGRSLQKHVELHGPLAVTDIVRIGQQIAAGLSAAHEQGLVHRDIKPANILLEKDVSRVMITDFGLARAADDAALTQSGWLAGTPHYMSPEQAMGDPIDHRSDLFSLGSVMFFMATGREPFRAEKSWAVLQKIGTSAPKSIRSINNQIPKPLEQIVEALMHKSPNRRIQSASDANQMLTDYLAHLQNPTVVRKPKPPQKPKLAQTAKPRRRMLALFGILALVSCVAYVQHFGLPKFRNPIRAQSLSNTPSQLASNITPSVPMAPLRLAPFASSFLHSINDGMIESQLSSLEKDIFRMESAESQQPEQSFDQLRLDIRTAEEQLGELERQLQR